MRERLSPYQYFAMMSVSYMVLLFWTYPRIAVQCAGTDGLWAIVGVVVAGIYIGWVHGRLNRVLPNIHGADMPVAVYGKVIGKLVTGLYLPIYALFVSVAVDLFVRGNIDPLLPRTPSELESCVMIIVGTVGAVYGVEALARVASILYPIAILFLMIILIVAIFSGASGLEVTWRFTSPLRTIRGVYNLLPLYLGFTTVLVLNTHFEHTKKTLRLPVLSTMLAGVVVVQGFIACILTIGYDALLHIQYPIPFLIRLQHISGWLVERSGIVIVITATGFTVMFLSHHLWAISEATCRLFSHDTRSFKKFLVPLSTVMMTTIVLIQNELTTHTVIRYILVPGSWFLLVVEPTLKLILVGFQKKKLRALSEALGSHSN